MTRENTGRQEPTFHAASSRVLRSGDDVVHCLLTGDALRALVAERRQVEPREQVLSGAEQDGLDGQVHLIDEPRLQILTNAGDAAAEPNVLGARRGSRAFQRRLDALGDEVK